MISPQQIAVICPTKDQPEKVKRLLGSLAASKIKPGQIIIADGGHNLKPVVEQFQNRLKVTCLYCPEPGQILQRNHAHQHLNNDVSVVIHLDDDITVGPDFMPLVVETWNRECRRPGKPLAGLSFNLMDLPQLRNSLFREAFFLSVNSAGSVSRGGYAVPFCPADQDRDVSWLLGGATAWSRDVLIQHPHPLSFPTRWAVCEDLIYSYPLNQAYRLMVAKDITCLHNDTYQSMSFQQGIFYGVSSAIMRYHFIRQHDEMKTWVWLWMTIGVAFGNLVKGLMGSPRHLGLFAGGVEGIFRSVICSMLNGDSKSLARSLATRKR